MDYPSGTADTSFAYDNAGRVTQMVDGTGTTSRVYDAAGQISSLAQPQRTLSYTYYTVGQRTAQSGAGQSQSWTFNSSNGRLTSQANDLGETTSFLYDSLGRLQKKTFSPGNYEAYTYDSRGRVSTIKLQNSSNAVVLDHTFTYDPSSKVVTNTRGSFATSYSGEGAGQWQLGFRHLC